MPTMRAAIATAEGIAFHDDVPRPVPGDHEVLVKVAAAGVNRADIGTAKATATSPFTIVGQEWAGEIVEMGKNVKGLKKGETVMCFGRSGGYAEYAVADAGWVMPFKTSDIKMEQAGVLPLALMTAHDALKTRGQLQSGQKVLVQGASSAVGIMTLQVARALGASVVAGTSRDESKYPRLTALGATLMLNSSKPDWADTLLKATDGKGVDVVVDFVSGPTVNDSMKATNVLGHIVNVGRLGGGTANFNFDLHAARRINYIGVTFRTRTIEEVREIFSEVRNDIWGAVESRKLQLPIDKVFSFAEIGKAFEHMEANKHLGKIVLSMPVA